MQSNTSPNRLAVLLTVAFLVGVGSTSTVYWLFVAPSGGSGDQIVEVVVPPGSTETTSISQVQTSSTDLSIELEPPISAVRSLEEVASMRSAYEQQLALRILLSNLDEAQVAELLTHSRDVFRNEDWLAAHSGIVQRLAHQNPSRALSLVLEADNPYNLGVFVTNVFKEWSHSKLDEAVSHARTLNPNLKEIALGVILRERTDLSDNTIRAIARDLGNEKLAISGIAQRRIEEAIDDPETAWNELAIDLQEDPENWFDIARVAKAWIEESGLSVLDQVNRSLTNTQTKQNVLHHIL